MHDTEAVRGIERCCHLSDKAKADRGLHWSARAQEFGERSPLHVLHRAPEEAVGGSGAVEWDDVGMVERGGEGGGAVKRLLGVWAGRGGAWHHLQGNGLVVLEIARQAHERGGSAAEHLLELEQPAEVLAGGGIDGVVPIVRRVDGGHGSDSVSTVNRSLSAVRPSAVARRVYPTPS